jgi:predicted amidohydrolase
MAEVTLGAANVKIAHDKARNLRRFLEIIEEAASQGVDVLVLPEVGLQGYADFAPPLGSKESIEQKQYYFREAESIPGPATEAIRQAAERHGMYVQLGLAERALSGNAIYNSTALIGSTGVLGVYRKIHNQFEFPYFCPGEDAPTIDTPIGRVGSVICYDLCFPELLRTYALDGADVVLMSTAWPMKGHDRPTDYHGWAMDISAQANAFFNQMWLVISNHCEKGVYSQGIDYYGGSQIVDPYGKVVASLADEEGLVVHRADLVKTTLESRTIGFFGLNLLQDRRPEHYGALVDDWYRHPGESVGAGLRRPMHEEPGHNGHDPRSALGRGQEATTTHRTRR